jgi:hypothetical protein
MRPNPEQDGATTTQRLRLSGRRSTGRIVVRSLALGATVFTLATFTGALLSGAAPAGTVITAVTEPVAAVSPSEEAAVSLTYVDPSDPLFAHSMIYTGVGALAVSIAGMIMVTRRRRHW